VHRTPAKYAGAGGGSLRDLGAFFWLRAFSTSQTLSTPAHTRVTHTVRPHAFLLGVKTARLVKWAVVVLARNQVFPAIVFSAVSFFLVSFF